MPHDRINMIKTEIDERKARIENSKDVLAQITPFVVVGISMLALCVIAYFTVQGAVKIAEYNLAASQTVASAIGSSYAKILEANGCKLSNQTLKDLGIQKEQPPTIPS